MARRLGWVLYGIKPVVLAVLVQAIVRLAPRAASTPLLRLVGVTAGIAALAGIGELTVLLPAGIVVATTRNPRAELLRARPLLPSLGGAAALTLPSIFLVFAKIGCLLFGSGYVLMAFLRSELVERLGWLTEAQLLDAIAVGQVTPGPVFTAATFVGFLLAGWQGAVAATVGIFLPAFCFVAVSGPVLPRLRASPTAAGFLDGVNVASLALLGAVAVELAGGAMVDPATVTIGLVAAGLLLGTRVSSAWLGGAGGLLGLGLHLSGLAAGALDP